MILRIRKTRKTRKTGIRFKRHAVFQEKAQPANNAENT